MRRSFTRITLVALLLLSAVLLSSCAFSFLKADMTKYIRIDESDYIGLTPTVDRAIINKDTDKVNDVWNKILALRTAKAEKGETLQSGAVSEFDQVGVYIWNIDSEGNVVATNMGYVEKNKDDSSSETSGKPGYQLIKIGYGEESEAFNAAVADMLYKVDEKGNITAEYVNQHRLIWLDEQDKELDAHSFVYVTYSTASASFSSQSKTSKQLINLDWWGKQEAGADKFYEAVARGLAKLGEDGKLKVRPNSSYTIHVLPVGSTPEKEEEADSVNLFYNCGAKDGEPESFDIKVTVHAGMLPYNSGEGEYRDLSTVYKYGEKASGTYTTLDGKTKKVSEAGDTTIYIYTMERTSYTVPAYDDAFINGEGFTADGKTGDELKAAFEKHLKEELQKIQDEKAEKAAKEALFEAFAKNLTDADYTVPEKEVKAYQKEQMDGLKYYYYTFYNGIYQQIYDTFEKFASSQLGLPSESNMTTIKNKLWENGVATVKHKLQIFGLAQALGVADPTDAEIYDRARTLLVEELNASNSSSTDTDKKVYTKEDISDAAAKKAAEESYGKDNLAGAILYEKVIDILYEKNRENVKWNDVTTADLAAKEKADTETGSKS